MIKTEYLDKFGTIGLFVTAAISPCCFPIFAVAASVLGLGSFELLGGWTMWIFQSLVLISIGGLFISYRQHKCMYPLAVAIPSSLLIFYGYHINESDHWIYFLYVGMLGLMISSVVNYFQNKYYGACADCFESDSTPAELESTITCPNCNYQQVEFMPTDACVYFYECPNCEVVSKPLAGDCCVYCSYGTVKCPPIQIGKNCC